MIAVDANELREAVLHLRDYERIALDTGNTRDAALIRQSIEALGDELAKDRVQTFARNEARNLEEQT